MKRFQVLQRLVNEHGWTRGAEIGVFEGRTFFHLLGNCPGLHLVGVDSWAGDTEPRQQDRELGTSSYKSQDDMSRNAAMVKRSAVGYPRATVLHMTSQEAAKTFEDGAFDFVFIDADHSTEAVLADVLAWRPKVREGGWILGHDQQWPSVQRALKQLFPQWSVHDDNVWSVP